MNGWAQKNRDQRYPIKPRTLVDHYIHSFPTTMKQLALIISLLFATTVDCCMQTLPSDVVESCSACPQNLAISSCTFNTGCSACLETTVNYDSSACTTASITCDDSTSQQYVRLKPVDGDNIEVKFEELSSITCSTTGTWLYSHSTGDVAIQSLTCFHYSTSTQMSPINIVPSTTTHDADLITEDFAFDYVQGDIDTVDIESGSHGFTITMIAEAQSRLTASHLDGDYQLRNLHAHWMAETVADEGSEHLLDGDRTAAELHFVHFNKKYGTFAEAVGQPEGLAVVGVFVEVGIANPEFEKITSLINGNFPYDEHKEFGNDDLQNIDIAQLMPADKSYYTYTGSLTTPEYNACVIWTVLKTPITISRAQLDTLLALYSGLMVRMEQDVISPIRRSFA